MKLVNFENVVLNHIMPEEAGAIKSLVLKEGGRDISISRDSIKFSYYGDNVVITKNDDNFEIIVNKKHVFEGSFEDMLWHIEYALIFDNIEECENALDIAEEQEDAVEIATFLKKIKKSPYRKEILKGLANGSLVINQWAKDLGGKVEIINEYSKDEGVCLLKTVFTKLDTKEPEKYLVHYGERLSFSVEKQQ